MYTHTKSSNISIHSYIYSRYTNGIQNRVRLGSVDDRLAPSTLCLDRGSSVDSMVVKSSPSDIPSSSFDFFRLDDAAAGDGGGLVISASFGAGVSDAFSGAGVVVLTGAGVLTGVFTAAGVLTVAGVLTGTVGFCNGAGDFPAGFGAGCSFAWVGAGFT